MAPSCNLQTLPTFSDSLTWHQFDGVVCLCYQWQALAEATQLTAGHHHCSVTYRTDVEAGLSVSGSHNVNNRCVQLWTAMLDEMHDGRTCWVPLGNLAWIQASPVLQPWKAAGTLEHTCQHAVAVHLQSRLAVSSSVHDKQFFLCCKPVPESEGRCPGWMTSPRTKAFGPFSAGSSAKDSTKSSYSLAASASAFCTISQHDAARDSSKESKV